MDRRTLLTSVAALTATAGCGGVAEPVQLTPDRRTSTAAESLVVYRRQDEHLSTVGVLHRQASDDARVPFEVTLAHADDVRITAMDLRFTTPDGPPGVPPELSLRRPTGRSFPGIDFGRTSDGSATRLTIPDVGEQGQGTLTLGFLLAGRTTPRTLGSNSPASSGSTWPTRR
jgi:hypothetical protein